MTIPIPEPDLASAHFFSALDQGRLEVLRCSTCDTAHLSVLACDVCGGSDFTAETASGRGTIYSFTKLHTAHHPAFTERLPVCGGIVELDEGPRLFAPLFGEAPPAIGARLQVELLPVEDRVIATFRLVQSAE
ncbi:OB-fold domain-containing protein [Sphingomonas sp. CL5.1]|uniref:Zn-ribbon domain-containing OB-fold protein n=1 Tax=Sphingomonas sp. CL5.1 TaxID=2653203 RepID=UPI00158436E4|nr:OB-fold domain-containing protein [Sphingomonas sp. CL5.1]QKS00262.1 OB-fold domain-containing protein [Sphingomonas sp. CL5.1]